MVERASEIWADGLLQLGQVDSSSWLYSRLAGRFFTFAPDFISFPCQTLYGIIGVEQDFVCFHL